MEPISFGYVRAYPWRVPCPPPPAPSSLQVTILAAARLEADQALRDRDAMSARLVEVEEKARCAVKERAFADCSAEEERALAKRSVTISDCFSAWKALAHSQRRWVRDSRIWGFGGGGGGGGGGDSERSLRMQFMLY